MTSLTEQERERIARLRGWIIRLLYTSRPHPVELESLTTMLDKKNFPLTRRGLANELDYLRSKRLVRVFPAGSDSEHDEVEQARLLQKYAATISDEEMGVTLCARLSAAGIDFQEGLSTTEGIERR